ncbi:MAG: hypothetical protein ABIH50_04890 [bacterium]
MANISNVSGSQSALYNYLEYSYNFKDPDATTGEQFARAAALPANIILTAGIIASYAASAISLCGCSGCDAPRPEELDAGHARDANVSLDAASPVDAGRADSSINLDAATTPDSAVDLDAAVSKDTYLPLDATPPRDARIIDSSINLDASTAPDSAVDIDAAVNLDANVASDANIFLDAATIDASPSPDAANFLDASIPDTFIPDSNIPDSYIPDSDIPDSYIPDSNVTPDAGCQEGETITTYSGPAGTANVGVCKPEIKVCRNGIFEIEQHEVLPQDPGICNDTDYNCDGRITNAKIGTDQRLTFTSRSSMYPSITWTGEEYGLLWTENQIFFTRLNKEGERLTNDIEITSGSSWPFTFRNSLAWDGNNFGLCWTNWYVTSSGTLPVEHYEANFSIVDPNGNKTIADIKIGNVDKSIEPTIIFANNYYAAAWTDNWEGQYNIYFNLLDTSGNKLLTDSRASTTGGMFELPSITWNGGGYGLSWWNNYNSVNSIYFAAYDAAGNKIGTEKKISEDAAWSAISALSWNNSYYGLAWDGNNGKISFNLIDPNGNTLIETTTIDANGSFPAIAAHGPDFSILWSRLESAGNREIYYNRLDVLGGKTQPDLRLTAASGLSSLSAFAWNGTDFGAVWEDNRDGNTELYFARVGCE